jgi:hypothetical protein
MEDAKPQPRESCSMLVDCATNLKGILYTSTPSLILHRAGCESRSIFKPYHRPSKKANKKTHSQNRAIPVISGRTGAPCLAYCPVRGVPGYNPACADFAVQGRSAGDSRRRLRFAASALTVVFLLLIEPVHPPMLNLIEPMDECPLLRPGKHLLARRATRA